MTDGLGPDYPWRAIRKTAMEKGPEEDIGKAMTRYLKAEERIRELEAELELAKAWETRKTRDWRGWAGEAQAQKARAEKAEAALRLCMEKDARQVEATEQAEARVAELEKLRQREAE